MGYEHVSGGEEIAFPCELLPYCGVLKNECAGEQPGGTSKAPGPLFPLPYCGFRGKYGKKGLCRPARSVSR